MADKPQATVTIKFRGVTIEGMTIQELSELRDLLDNFLPRKVERVTEHHYHDLVYRPYAVYPNTIANPIWTCGITTTAGNRLVPDHNQSIFANSALNLSAGNLASNVVAHDGSEHYVISLN